MTRAVKHGGRPGQCSDPSNNSVICCVTSKGRPTRLFVVALFKTIQEKSEHSNHKLKMVDNYVVGEYHPLSLVDHKTNAK